MAQNKIVQGTFKIRLDGENIVDAQRYAMMSINNASKLSYANIYIHLWYTKYLHASRKVPERDAARRHTGGTENCIYVYMFSWRKMCLQL